MGQSSVAGMENSRSPFDFGRGRLSTTLPRPAGTGPSGSKAGRGRRNATYRANGISATGYNSREFKGQLVIPKPIGK